MRNRLEQLMQGQFEYDLPKMQLSGRTVSVSAPRNAEAAGAFVITAPGDGKMSGLLHSDNPRIRLASEEFSGHENIVRFEAETDGMAPGETTEGRIWISSDLGQEHVTVKVQVLNEPEPGDFPDPEELCAEAERDYEHAARQFAAPAYETFLMARAGEPEKALYLGLKKDSSPYRRLEEFLVGTGRKESVDLSCDWTQKRVTDPEGTLRETIRLTAGGWGFLEIGISSDARFLRPEKETVTTLDFIGRSCEIGLIIDSNFLHAGKNYGRITIRTCYQVLELTVRADRTGNEEERRLHRVRCLMRRKAAGLYLDYRTGKIDLHSWAGRTESVLNAYRRAGGKDVYADLFTIFVLQADGKRREAEHLLADLEKNPERLTTPDRYAFLLFLTTFFTRDDGYIGRVRKTVKRLYAENPDNWKICWVCLYLLDGSFDEKGGRLGEILDQIGRGCSSPFLYLEAALELRKNPYLLYEMTPAMRLVLNFASSQGLITEQLCLEISSIERKKPHYDPVMFRVLERCYETFRMRDSLEALCAMAIEGGRREERFFPLYRTAVMKEIPVTGLYEYYMDSMEECRIETMPEVIRRYFLYSDTLDYHKKARIFRNMADSRSSIPEIFRSMEGALRKFLADQLAQSHIDNDLAVLYSEFLTRPMLTDRLAGNLLRLLFTYRIECLSPGMKKILVTDSRMEDIRETPLQNSSGLVRIYSGDTRILLEDGDGRRYASTSLYMADHFLESRRLLDLCVSVIPDAPELALFYTLNTVRSSPVDASSLRYFCRAEGMRILTEKYRGKIRGWILDYYLAEPDDPSLPAFLRDIRLTDYAACGVSKLQTLLVGEGFYEQAYRLVLQYGHDHTPLNLLVRICSQMVLAAEYQEDRKLIDICAYCFFSGKYDANILSYLLMYYDSAVPEMETLWRAGKQYGADTMKLEEKILSLIVFEYGQENGSGEIYASYRSSLGNRKLCRAYTVLMSYRAFVKGEPLGDAVFRDLLADAEKGERLPDVCALALLKRLAGQRGEDGASPEDGRKDETVMEDPEGPGTSSFQDPEDGKKDEAVVRTEEKLLGDLEDRGMRFAFFQKFPERMHTVSGIGEKTFFEYMASPSSVVTLSFRKKGSQEPYTEETMKDVFSGVRVREFVLFGSEELECFTEEAREDGTRILSGLHTLKSRRVSPEMEETRYGRLSALSDAFACGDREKAGRILLDFRETEAVTEQLFTLL